MIIWILVILLVLISSGSGAMIYILIKRHQELLKEKEAYEKSTLRTRMRNDRDLEMARKIQQGLLVSQRIQHKTFQISAVCLPAERIGGDFFGLQKKIKDDIEQLEEQKGIIRLSNKRQESLNMLIGDVSGHGVASALVMILAKNYLEDLLSHNYSPKQIMQIANKQIISYTEGSEINFVTVFLAKFNCQNNMLTYAKAGHTSPLLFRKSGQIEHLETEGVFLGMFENPEFEEKQVKIEKGDKLFLYTDGLNEAKNPAGELLGIQRLKDIIKSHLWLSGEHLFNKVLEEINEYTNHEGLNDDATMVLFEAT